MIRGSSRVWDESGRVHQSPANHCASKYQMIRHRYAPRLRVGAVSPYRNYLSTMLPRPFKDLEWHKRKKHRRRFLSLLLRGLLATRQSRSLRLKKTQRVSAVVKTTLAPRQKLLRESFQS